MVTTNFLSIRCACNWGDRCKEIKRSLVDAGDTVLTRSHVVSTWGVRTVAYRSAIQHHFKISTESKDDYKIARHHWPPQLVSDNYPNQDCASKRVFSKLMSKKEVAGYNSAMADEVNSYESCMRRCGVNIDMDDPKRRLFTQAPVQSYNDVEMYVKALIRGSKRTTQTDLIETPAQPILPATAVVSLPVPRVLDHAFRTPTPRRDSPEPFPSVEELRAVVKYRIANYTTEENVSNCKLQFCFKMLGDYHKAFHPIACVGPVVDDHAPRVVIYPCRGYERDVYNVCTLFATRRRLYEKHHMLCESCRKKKDAVIRHTKAKADDVNRDARTAPSSKVKINCLSPGEIRAKLKRVITERKGLSQRVKRLEARLNSGDNNLKLSECDSNLQSTISNAFEAIARMSDEDKTEAKKHIVQELMALSMKSEDKDERLSQEDAESFAGYTISQIENKAKVVDGRRNQVDFSPELLRSAIALYTRSKTGYKEHRTLSPSVFPSPSKLDTILRQTRVKEGSNPKIYGHFYDEYVSNDLRNEVGAIIAQLIFDEMKLKTGVFWRTSDHKACGFSSSSDTNSMTAVLRDMLEKDRQEDAKLYEDTKVPSLYVNQWRLRTGHNVIHNSEFFFNNGELSGDDLLRQMMSVIIGYESIGVKICAIVCDAGGSNRGLFRLLRNGARPSMAGARIDRSSLTFANPWDPSRLIAFYNCSTHNLKSMRNQLLRSHWGKGKRKFIYDSAPFGWRTIVESYERDIERTETRGTVQETRLSRAATQPDKWELMCVSIAKAVFHIDTISELAQHIATGIGKVDQFNETVSSRSDDLYTTRDLVRAQVQFLKDEFQSNSSLHLEWKSQFNVLQYMAVVFGVFIDVFMNKDVRLTNENIEQVRCRIDNSLEFLRSWQCEQEVLQADPLVDKPGSFFLSQITYVNLRTAIDGFFEYASIVLSVDGGPKFVPMLHSNSSVLEALFSQMRSMNRDTPERYISGLGAVNTSMCIMYLEKNKMYDAEQVGKVKAVDPVEAVMRRRVKKRNSIIDEWKKLRQIHPESTTAVSRFATAFSCQNKKTAPVFLLIKQGSTIDGGFANELIMRDQECKAHAFSSIFTEHQKWFHAMYRLSGALSDTFDTVCQNILGDLMLLFEDSMYAPRNSIGSKYFWQLLCYYQGGNDSKLNQRVQEMPTPELQSRAGTIIIVKILSSWLLRWISDAMTELSFDLIISSGDETSIHTLDRTLKPQDEKREVNRFLGWAVFSLRKKLLDRRLRAEENDWCLTEDVNKMIEFLDGMRIFHNEAITDKEYMRDCYASSDVVRNGGWLSLISKNCFAFGQILMQEIRLSIEGQWIRRGNATVKIAMEKLTSNSLIKLKFLESCAEVPLSDKMKYSVFTKLVKKAFHSRVEASLRVYKEQNTDRHVDGANDESLRGKLKTLTLKNTKEQAKRLRSKSVNGLQPPPSKKRKS